MSLKVIKTWCKTEQPLLQNFTRENGAECGSKNRTSEWGWGHKSKIKYIAGRQKAQECQVLDILNKLFICQAGEDQKKKNVLMK